MPGLMRREPRGEAADTFNWFDRLFNERARMMPFRPMPSKHWWGVEDLIRVEEYRQDGGGIDFADIFGPGASGFGGLFERLFGRPEAGPARGEDLRVNLVLSLHQVLTGGKQVVSISAGGDPGEPEHHHRAEHRLLHHADERFDAAGDHGLDQPGTSARRGWPAGGALRHAPAPCRSVRRRRGDGRGDRPDGSSGSP